MTCNTSAVAVCRSFASFSSRVSLPTCFCRSAMDVAALGGLRALGLFARRPLTSCSLPPRCRISFPRRSRRGSSLSKSWVSCHGKRSSGSEDEACARVGPQELVRDLGLGHLVERFTSAVQWNNVVDVDTL